MFRSSLKHSVQLARAMLINPRGDETIMPLQLMSHHLLCNDHSIHQLAAMPSGTARSAGAWV